METARYKALKRTMLSALLPTKQQPFYVEVGDIVEIKHNDIYWIHPEGKGEQLCCDFCHFVTDNPETWEKL